MAIESHKASTMQGDQTTSQRDPRLEASDSSEAVRRMLGRAPPTFIPAFHGYAVLGKKSTGVTWAGSPNPVAFGEDDADHYAAIRDVSVRSAPSELAKFVGERGSVVYTSGGELSPVTIGAIRVCAWLPLGKRPLRKSEVGESTFRRGRQLWVAELLDAQWDVIDAAAITLNDPAELVSWDVSIAPEKLRRLVVSQVSTLPSFAEQQKDYEGFKKRLSTAARDVEQRQAASPSSHEFDWFTAPRLPDSWTGEGRGFIQVWQVGVTRNAPILIVAYISQMVEYSVPTEYAPDGPACHNESRCRRATFAGSLLSMWAVGGDSWIGPRIDAIGSTEDIFRFEPYAAVSYDAGAPTILFRAAGMAGELRPVDSQYERLTTLRFQ